MSKMKFQYKEPLVLEQEDWSFQEWMTICKLCGLPLGQTERIVLHMDEMECFVDLSKKALDCERTYTVTEMCPHCESEVEMCWNTDTMGFKAFCPVCGGRLMLCDECQHTDEPSLCDYGVSGDGCWRLFDEQHCERIRSLPYGEGIDLADQLAKLLYLKQLCIECKSRTCQYNHGGECRFAMVHERKVRITGDEGCIDYDYQEGEV